MNKHFYITLTSLLLLTDFTTHSMDSKENKSVGACCTQSASSATPKFAPKLIERAESIIGYPDCLLKIHLDNLKKNCPTLIAPDFPHLKTILTCIQKDNVLPHDASPQERYMVKIARCFDMAVEGLLRERTDPDLLKYLIEKRLRDLPKNLQNSVKALAMAHAEQRGDRKAMTHLKELSPSPDRKSEESQLSIANASGAQSASTAAQASLSSSPSDSSQLTARVAEKVNNSLAEMKKHIDLYLASHTHATPHDPVRLQQILKSLSIKSIPPKISNEEKLILKITEAFDDTLRNLIGQCAQLEAQQATINYILNLIPGDIRNFVLQTAEVRAKINNDAQGAAFLATLSSSPKDKLPKETDPSTLSSSLACTDVPSAQKEPFTLSRPASTSTSDSAVSSLSCTPGPTQTVEKSSSIEQMKHFIHSYENSPKPFVPPTSARLKEILESLKTLQSPRNFSQEEQHMIKIARHLDDAIEELSEKQTDPNLLKLEAETLLQLVPTCIRDFARHVAIIRAEYDGDTKSADFLKNLSLSDATHLIDEKKIPPTGVLSSKSACSSSTMVQSAAGSDASAQSLLCVAPASQPAQPPMLAQPADRSYLGLALTFLLERMLYCGKRQNR